MSSTPASLSSSKATVQAVNCPQCGATLTMRSFGHAVSLICESCHSVLDALDPKLKILQTFKTATNEEQPLIPLGSRGKWRGIDYQVIGFQRRSIHVEGIEYSWHEYLLFNPFRGFRYLSEYNGHWNDILPLNFLPAAEEEVRVTCDGKNYRHFQSAKAKTKFVLGEFPWQVRVGETAYVCDYVAPPFVVSSEQMDEEVTWSRGEYVSGKDLWKAFKLPGDPPAPIGVYANQPSPMRASMGSVLKTFAVFCGLLLLLLIANAIMSAGAKSFTATYYLQPASTQEQSFVTPVFRLGGRVSDVELKSYASLSNEWIYLNYALINQDTGQAWDVGRELSYYSGYDSDGSWTEGSKNDSVVISSVPPGNYYLRIEPESDRSFPTIPYNVEVIRDVAVLRLYLIAFGALLLPAIFILWRTFSFEQMRWAESDHPLGSFLHQDSSSSGDSDDD